ncbi:Nif3-like dinuclear metal center hexameric protein [Staphylococcus sp. FSL H8-0121]|uniref:Nif3-like dinuclear metal center hexameric protein n=1 Tax=Staphylococcus TaxID=1279 RepID=UPI0030FD0CDE
MKVNELMAMLDEHVPFNTAESWDNVGLLIGDESQEVNGILTALDCTIDVVQQAINENVNTIISHHPLIFKGIQSITNQGYGEIIRLLIQNNINLIAMHTNLDVNPNGVNAMLASKIGLQHTQLINKEPIQYYKVQTIIPEDHLETFKQQLNDIGLAKEGDYEYCFFESKGRGQFKPVGDADPYIGSIDEIEYVDEVKLEFMISYQQRQLTERAIHHYHPYETPVYDFIELNKEGNYGLGIMGELKEPMKIEDFVEQVKRQLQIPSVRYVGNSNAMISKVAMIGGSGIGFEYKAAQLGADIFITGDIKHHDALDAKIEGINLLDINHYSEYVMKEGLKLLLQEWLLEENSNDIKVVASNINTDPFTYI